MGEREVKRSRCVKSAVTVQRAWMKRWAGEKGFRTGAAAVGGSAGVRGTLRKNQGAIASAKGKPSPFALKAEVRIINLVGGIMTINYGVKTD